MCSYINCYCYFLIDAYQYFEYNTVLWLLDIKSTESNDAIGTGSNRDETNFWS